MINILITTNRNYLHQLKVLIKSLEVSNPDEKFNIYILQRDFTQATKKELTTSADKLKTTINYIKVLSDDFKDFPIVDKRYPLEIYYKLFASIYLPKEIDRILYLDPDIVVINSIKDFYHHPFKDNYYIATSHVFGIVKIFNNLRLNLSKDTPYINAGVLLINNKKLRDLDIKNIIYSYVKKNKHKLMLPEQDIISSLFGNKTIIIDELIYNLGDRAVKLYNRSHKKNEINLNWVNKNTKIIHYYGKNKPWKKSYRGILSIYYYNYDSLLKEEKNKNFPKTYCQK